MAEPTTENKTTSRKDAIALAVETENKAENQDKDTTVDPGEKTDKPDEKETKENPKEQTEEERLESDEALKLFKALKNPDTRGTVIEFLAKNAGYEKKGALETKTDVKEAAADLTSSMKEGLGEQFEFLADKLAPAIEKYLEKKRQEDLVEIKATLEAQEREKLEGQSAKAISKLTSDFFGEDVELPSNVQNEMSKFMDKVPPSQDLSVKEYVELAFNAAIGKLGLSKADKTKDKKIEKNRSDVAGRLASDRSASRTAEAVTSPSKTMNRREAIEAAMEAASKAN
jgi:hypothetical protein